MSNGIMLVVSEGMTRIAPWGDCTEERGCDSGNGSQPTQARLGAAKTEREATVAAGLLPLDAGRQNAGRSGLQKKGQRTPCDHCGGLSQGIA